MSPSRAFRIATDQDQDLKVDSQEMGSKGWYALGWSFIASAGLTVSESSGDLEEKTAYTARYTVPELPVPGRVCHSGIRYCRHGGWYQLCSGLAVLVSHISIKRSTGG